MKFHFTANAKNTIKSALKKDFQQSGREIWIPKKENMMIQKIKDRQLKKDITIKKN